MRLKYIFGPVPSRRLGISLGVDIVPFKTCSLNCVYCQLGKTKTRTIRQERFVNPEDVLNELNFVLSRRRDIDYITFSGSGEPTLNTDIREIIQAIKGVVTIPVAVLTNGTLLSENRVRQALCQADLVIPSLDAATQNVFESINRPHTSLKVDRMIEGLRRFRDEFDGEIWIELMLVKGLNDHYDELKKIRSIVSKLHPVKIQLNTVVRPPAEGFAQGLTSEELQKVRAFLGEECSIVEGFQKKERGFNEIDVRSSIVDLTRRRSVTLSDITDSLGIHRNEAVKYLNDLEREKIIRRVVHKGQNYYGRMNRLQGDNP